MELLSTFTLRALLLMIINTQVNGEHNDCFDMEEVENGNTSDSPRYYQLKDRSRSMDFVEASEICKCKNLRLVSPKDNIMTDDLRNIFQYDFWINLKRTTLEKFTCVETGIEYLGTIKDLKEDNQNHNCVFVKVNNGGHGKLTASPCHTQRAYICRPQNIKEGALPFDTHYGNLSWYDARKKCLSLPGDLACPTGLLEKYPLTKGEYWIGLHKEEWIWGDGTSLTYSNWDTERQQPSDINEECVVSKETHNGAWHDVRCRETSGVVCVSGDDVNSITDGPGTLPVSDEVKYGDDVNSITDRPGTLPVSNEVKYALIAVCAACGILIIILTIVLICMCCRRRRRRTPPEQDFHRPRAFSQVSKVGVALPTPPGPPARHSLHEGMYDAISLEEVHDQGPYSMGTFQRGLSGRSSYDGLNNVPNSGNPDIGGANGLMRKNYAHINCRQDAAMSLTYDTVIADNDCYA